MTTIYINLSECVDLLNTIIDKTKDKFVKLTLRVIRNYLDDMLFEESILKEEDRNVQFPENTECDNGGSDLPF